MAGGESSDQMNVDKKNGSKEIRINYPSEFDGNRENLESFLQDCHLYLAINNETYNNDMKKIVFMLSFMKKGTATSWKEAWTQEKLATTTQDFGTLKDFIEELKKAFRASDTEGDARARLRQLRQGKGTVDEYVAEFRILAGKAKMREEDKALTEYFMEGINTGILQKIFAQETLPTTIDEWYTQASKYDAQYRRVQEILERRRGTTTGNTHISQTKKTFVPRYVPRYTSNSRDPNAMDIDQITTTIDRLTNEERERHVRENRCFKCHKIGHISRNCRSGQNISKPTEERAMIKYEGKKTANTTRAMIRNLVTGMEKEEKDKLFENMMNDEDF